MKGNEELQKDVQNAIKWEPLLNAAEIGVIAKDGIVTLTGTVDSYAKKLEAEDAAKNVAGIKALIEKLVVKFPASHGKKDDNEVAMEILSAFKWNWQIPDDKIDIKVENGWVTLAGEVHWNYQKEAAKSAVKHLLGVIGVSDNLTIQSESHDEIEKNEIESAMKRNWSIYDQDIQVAVAGTKVTLTGTVNSLKQKSEAARIAWNAPGVWSVENDLEIEYQTSFVD